MNKKVIVTTLVIVVLLAIVAIPSVFAGGASFKCCSAGSIHADGSIWGLGNTNVNVLMTASGKVQALCQNNGGNQAPGRNPVTVEVTSTALWYVDENGKAEGHIFADNPTLDDVVAVSPNPKDMGCPSESWTVVGLDTANMQWTGVNFHVTSAVDGSTLYDISFSCTGVGAALTCTQQ